LKSFEGNTGFRARQFFRYFREIEEKGNFLEGITVENNVILKTIVGNFQNKLPETFDEKYVDNKILSMLLHDEYKDFTLLTNDISMRVKASSFGIKSLILDSTDKHKLDDLYNGICEIKVSDEHCKEFYQNGEILISKLGIDDLCPNEFFHGFTEHSYNKIIGKYDKKKEKIVTLKNENASIFGITAKDMRQNFAIEALLDTSIPFVTITSRQGCGKTILALASAMEQVLEQNIYEKILIGKNTSPIDKWSYQGFTTGDTEEKLLTHFGNFTTTFENIQNIRGKKSKSGIEVLQLLKNQNKLDILDISSILGSSFSNRIIIIDEAQSFDIHAIRSIITRIGENSKLILIGDIGQQTISRLDPDKSGLYVAVEWLKELEETAHITLNSVHRSSFVDNASKLFDKKMFG
jgi:PhoH-like ATPase